MFKWEHWNWTPRGLRFKTIVESTIIILATIAVVVISGWQ
jgi:hypothetical protein